NQPDVGRGTQRLDVVEQMHTHLFATRPLDRVEVCYDPTPEGSVCYKPAPGMLFRAVAELRLDFAKCYIIGDPWRDVDCGHAASCSTIFIDRGYREDSGGGQGER